MSLLHRVLLLGDMRACSAQTMSILLLHGSIPVCLCVQTHTRSPSTIQLQIASSMP